MKLRNKRNGKIINSKELLTDDFIIDLFSQDFDYFNSKLNKIVREWEEVEEYRYVLPNRVRRAIISWVKAQDNPIEKISILLKSYYDTKEVDSDGFYDYEFYGYVSDNNKNLVANTLSIRLKKPFVYKEYKDYTLPELGIVGIFGGER